MLSFIQKLDEDKNTHLEHLEDEIINNGLAGANTAVQFLYSLTDMLSGSGGKGTAVTVKWDGAPAVFAGINPENGKFFVATKSLFNKTPKINYTNKDISNNHGSGGLSDKLKVALKYLPALGMDGIFQGDIMFGKDTLKQETIDGVKMLTFTPNTITYAVPDDSKLASTIRKAHLGVVWHTKYTGKTIATLKAQFGVNAGVFSKTSKIWFDDATMKDTSGAVFNKSQIGSMERKINMVAGAIKKAGRFLNVIKGDQSTLSLAGQLKIFFNSKIRSGAGLKDTKALQKEFGEYYTDRMGKEIDLRKSEKGKKKYKDIKKQVVKDLKKHKNDIYFAIATYLGIKEAKMMVVRQLEKIQSIGTFLKTPDGFKVTAPEGYVAINSKSGSAVKLVDRLGFSHANFTLAKDWVKG